MSFIQRQFDRNPVAHSPQFTFGEYVAQHNADQANAFLVNQSYPESTSIPVLAKRIGHYLNKHGETGLRKMMYLHPDREEIMQTISPADHKPGFHNASGGFQQNNPGFFGPPSFHNCGGCASGSFSNCSGCGGGCGGAKHNNASGGTANSGNTEKTLNTLAVVAIIGIIFLAAIRN